MGLVLDSSVLTFAERETKPVSSLLAGLQQQHGENEIVLSSITVVELEHGLHRYERGTKATRLSRHCFRGDSGGELQQGNGADRRESGPKRAKPGK